MAIQTAPSPPLLILVMAGLHSRDNLKDAWKSGRIARATRPGGGGEERGEERGGERGGGGGGGGGGGVCFGDMRGC